MRQVILATLTIALITVSSVVWYRAVAARQTGMQQSELQGVLLPQPRALTEFTLADQHQTAFGKERLIGRWTMLFFGYTYCPDICPTTMLTLKEAQRKLVQSGNISPQIVLVSVDPVRDDSETLARYVGHFGETNLGLRGSDEQLLMLTQQVGAMYERDAPDADGNYQVAHSGSIFVINPAGGLHAIFSAPHRADFIAEKMAIIVNNYGAL